MTIEQIQHLLAFLGYYKIPVDGVWGPASEEACGKFQEDFGGIAVDKIPGKQTQDALCHTVAFGLPEREDKPQKPDKPAGSDGGIWETSKYFARAEFRCKCGKCGGFPAEPAPKLVRFLNQAREDLGAPGIIISGVRCPAHNAAVGGVPTSRHTKGWAVDIMFQGKTPAQMEAYFKSRPETAYCYQIKDSNGRLCGDVHVDVVV